MIARFDPRHTRPNGVHHPSALVADNRRQVDRLIAMHCLPVGVAETAGCNLHPHFAGTGVTDFDFFNAQFAGGGIEHGGFHLHYRLLFLPLINNPSVVNTDRKDHSFIRVSPYRCPLALHCLVSFVVVNCVTQKRLRRSVVNSDVPVGD